MDAVEQFKLKNKFWAEFTVLEAADFLKARKDLDDFKVQMHGMERLDALIDEVVEETSQLKRMRLAGERKQAKQAKPRK